MSHINVLNNAENEYNIRQFPKKIFINDAVWETFSCSQQVVYKWKLNKYFSQWEFTCSNSTKETLERDAKHVNKYTRATSLTLFWCLYF